MSKDAMLWYDTVQNGKRLDRIEKMLGIFDPERCEHTKIGKGIGSGNIVRYIDVCLECGKRFE